MTKFRYCALPVLMAFAFTATTGVSDAADNLIGNGDFSADKLTPWKLTSKKGIASVDAIVQNNVLQIRIDSATDQNHYRQLIQPVDLQSGMRYRLSFDAKVGAASDAEVLVVVTPKTHQKGQYSLFRRFAFSPDWKSYQAYFTAKETDSSESLFLKFNLGTLDADLYLRNVVLKQVKPKDQE